jgi:dGTPase
LSKSNGRIDFEGNANGFSVLTASRPGIEGGLRILMRLRRFYEISKREFAKNQQKYIAEKYGFFQTDKKSF